MLSISGTAFAQDQSVEEFYASNPIRLMVGYSPGGGYDANARLLARHLGKYIPGEPDIIVENMPGGGSVTLTNYLLNVAARDGTVIGAVSRSIATEPLIGSGVVDFDANELTWIGSLGEEASVCVVWHESEVEDWADVMEGTQEVVIGGTGAVSDNEVFPRLQANLFGASINIISGYGGSAEVDLAMEIGEVEARCGSWSSMLTANRSWIEEGRVRVLLQVAENSIEGLEDVPLIGDFVETEEQQQILDLVLSRLSIAWPYIAPPDFPEDRLEAIRSAFVAAARDPELLAEAERMGVVMDPMFGADVAEAVRALYETPPEVIEMTRSVLSAE